jgi:hypothetical protein
VAGSGGEAEDGPGDEFDEVVEADDEEAGADADEDGEEEEAVGFVTTDAIEEAEERVDHRASLSRRAKT